jgi:hypothetical protein
MAVIPGVYPLAIWFRRIALRRARQKLGNFFRPITFSTTSRLGPPKQCVSLYELLKKNDPAVEGEIILHGQDATPIQPGSMADLAGWTRFKPQQPFPIIWTKHRNARLVSGSLALVLPPKTLALESSYGFDWLPAEPAYHYLWLPKPVTLEGNYTSIISTWARSNRPCNFSHWLLDVLPRLAALNRFPEDTQILVPALLASYQKESLDLLGLAGRYRPTPESHLIVENYYLSSPTSSIVWENAYALAFLRDRFLPKASATFNGPKRFIIDRGGERRGVKNREEFNQFFRDLGWAIIDTAKLSFADEIKLFMEAEAFAGAIGSGFTNAVWCKPGCAVIQFACDQVLDGSTEWICAHNHLRWKFLICPADNVQRVEVDLKEVRKILAELNLL